MMLELVRDLCRRLKIGFAWHTGSVPQQRRRAEINAFKGDPNCRVFLSTDSGSTGLNLQNASVVVNCDLPWNPAKLEQRIARAWRKNQTRSVTVINLVSEKTIEHGMLATLANKQALADGVLDRRGDLDAIPLRGGSQIGRCVGRAKGFGIVDDEKNAHGLAGASRTPTGIRLSRATQTRNLQRRIGRRDNGRSRILSTLVVWMASDGRYQDEVWLLRQWR